MTIINFSTSSEDSILIWKLTSNIKRTRSIKAITICSNYEAYLEAKSLGLKPKLSSSYFDTKKADGDYILSGKYAQKWFSKLVKISYLNQPVAKIVALPLHHFFAEYIRALKIAKKIVSTEKPASIVINPNYISSLYQRWTPEDFTLENIILIEQAKRKKIPINFLKKENTINHERSSNTIYLLFKSILNLISIKKYQRKILLFAHFHQLANMKNIIKKLDENGIGYYIIGRTKYNNHNFISFQRFIFPIDIIKNLIFSITCYFGSQTINKNSLFKSPSIYKKITYTIKKELPRVALLLSQSDNIINLLKPPLVLCGASTDVLDQAFVRMCLQNNIKTIVPQHGIATRFEQDYYLGDIIPVWGQISKNIFTTYGQNKNKIIPIGFPLFDNYSSIYSLKNEKKIILFLSTSIIGAEKLFATNALDEVYANFINAMKKIPSYKAIIRLHPGSNPEKLFRLAKKLNYELIDYRNYSLSESIEIANYIVTLPTTAGLEAIILGKKVIYYNNTKNIRPEYKFFEQTGPVINNFNRLHKIIDNTDWDTFTNGRKKFIKNYFQNLDGQSSTRLLKLLEKST